MAAMSIASMWVDRNADSEGRPFILAAQKLGRFSHAKRGALPDGHSSSEPSVQVNTAVTAIAWGSALHDIYAMSDSVGRNEADDAWQ